MAWKSRLLTMRSCRAWPSIDARVDLPHVEDDGQPRVARARMADLRGAGAGGEDRVGLRELAQHPRFGGRQARRAAEVRYFLVLRVNLVLNVFCCIR